MLKQPISDDTKERMRQFTAITRFAIRAGTVRRSGSSGKISLHRLGDDYGLSYYHIQVCRARAVAQIDEIDHLDRERQLSRKRSKRYDWDYIDKPRKRARPNPRTRI